jgi:hypothetical protein
MKQKVAAVLAVVVLYPLVGVNAQGGTTYKTRLSPVPLDAKMVGNVVGLGSVTATLVNSKLSVTGTFEGLRSPATAARVHKSPKAGVRGPAILDLKVSPGTSGTITGAFDLTAAQIQELAQGRYYVQLHSEKAPDGNLWGWLALQENRQ